MEVKTEIVDMRIGFIITDETYTIKEALNNDLLRMGDWFECGGDIYRLIGYSGDNICKVGYCVNGEGDCDINTYIGARVNKERTKRENNLVIYEGDGNMFDEQIRCYFDKMDKIRLVEFEPWKCVE